MSTGEGNGPPGKGTGQRILRRNFILRRTTTRLISTGPPPDLENRANFCRGSPLDRVNVNLRGEMVDCERFPELRVENNIVSQDSLQQPIINRLTMDSDF